MEGGRKREAVSTGRRALASVTRIGARIAAATTGNDGTGKRAGRVLRCVAAGHQRVSVTLIGAYCTGAATTEGFCKILRVFGGRMRASTTRIGVAMKTAAAEISAAGGESFELETMRRLFAAACTATSATESGRKTIGAP